MNLYSAQMINNASFLSLQREASPFAKLISDKANNGAKTNPLNNSNDLEQLKEACDGFEAILVNFLLSQMRKTVKKNNLFGEGSFASESFTSFFDNEISRSIAKSGALNISNGLFQQLTNGMPVTGKGLLYGK